MKISSWTHKDIYFFLFQSHHKVLSQLQLHWFGELMTLLRLVHFKLPQLLNNTNWNICLRIYYSDFTNTKSHLRSHVSNQQFLTNTWSLNLFGSALPREASLRKSNVSPKVGLWWTDPSACSYISSLEPDVAKLLNLDHLSLPL